MVGAAAFAAAAAVAAAAASPILGAAVLFLAALAHVLWPPAGQPVRVEELWICAPSCAVSVTPS